jgi:hypothetical protein
MVLRAYKNYYIEPAIALGLTPDSPNLELTVTSRAQRTGCCEPGAAPVRYANMVRQALDFSCGAAALATIINDYWAKPVSESDVIEILMKRYPVKVF